MSLKKILQGVALGSVLLAGSGCVSTSRKETQKEYQNLKNIGVEFCPGIVERDELEKKYKKYEGTNK